MSSSALTARWIDLQKEVHEDMTAHFPLYPRRWGLTGQTPTSTIVASPT